MQDKNVIFRGAPASVFKLTEAPTGSVPNGVDQITDRIQILKVGTFNHDEYGTFEITKETLLAFAENFKNRVRGIDIAVDYFHESDKIAAGWFRDLYLSEDGTELYALVDWTPKAQDMIKSRELRYVSADFQFNYQNNETLQSFGPTLLGAGLTNRPVIKEMQPIILKEIDPSKQEPQKGDNMDPKDKEIADLKAQIEELKKGSAPAKPVVPPVDHGAAMADLQKKCDEALAELAKYKASEAQAAEAQKLADKKGAFDKLMSEGKAVEAQREAWMKGDMVKYAELTQTVKLSEIGTRREGSHLVEDDSAQVEVDKQAKKLLSEKKTKDYSDAVKMVFAENKELKERYYKETRI